MQISKIKSAYGGQISKYFGDWWAIMLRPIYFFTVLEEERWQEKPLSFLLLTSWVLAFFATLVIFLIQYVPLGRYLIEGVVGPKFIIILPVLATLALVFFLITFLILGGFFVAALFILFYLVALLMHYSCQLFVKAGSLNQVIQQNFYSSAAVLPLILGILLMLLPKYFGLEFNLFRAGYNFIYYLLLLYIYGLWAIIIRKVYGLAKWQAFSLAVLPVLAMLIFGVLFDKIAISKLDSWIT